MLGDRESPCGGFLCFFFFLANETSCHTSHIETLNVRWKTYLTVPRQARLAIVASRVFERLRRRFTAVLKLFSLLTVC